MTIPLLNIDQQWVIIKNIISAAKETVGERKINVNKKNRTSWFTPDIKKIVERKKKAYIQFIHNQTPENRYNYTQQRNLANSRIRKIKESYWEGFIKGMERDLYGHQKRI